MSFNNKWLLFFYTWLIPMFDKPLLYKLFSIAYQIANKYNVIFLYM
jgi:hypothetical protein